MWLHCDVVTHAHSESTENSRSQDNSVYVSDNPRLNVERQSLLEQTSVAVLSAWFPKGHVTVGNMQNACSFLCLGIFQIYFCVANYSCLMVSCVGMVGHFLNPLTFQEKNPKNVSDKLDKYPACLQDFPADLPSCPQGVSSSFVLAQSKCILVASGKPTAQKSRKALQMRKFLSCREGSSLVPLLKTDTNWDREGALYQFKRRNDMGYSIRTSTHRFTVWLHCDVDTLEVGTVCIYVGGIPGAVWGLGHSIRTSTHRFTVWLHCDVATLEMDTHLWLIWKTSSQKPSVQLRFQGKNKEVFRANLSEGAESCGFLFKDKAIA